MVAATAQHHNMNRSASIFKVQTRGGSKTDLGTGSTGRRFTYFTEFTYSKGIFYGLVVGYVLAVCVVVVLEMFLTDAMLSCDSTVMSASEQRAVTTEYGNPSFTYDPCRYRRVPRLLYMTRIECAFGRSLVMSVLLGGVVGWERRMADRPAGIRTMALVSLGSCLFGINSTFGFLDGPMAWDSSRVAAAIPSGVGFLGAGLIFKEADKDTVTGDTTHVVHGLTTAASLWIVRCLIRGIFGYVTLIFRISSQCHS
jgi:putative Mg2+ transporter-C (MgtC) family protein